MTSEVRKILVTGSRSWTDRKRVADVLDAEYIACPANTDLLIIHGAARGAEDMAEKWVKDIRAVYDDGSVTSLPYKPRYDLYDSNVAPKLCNQAMIDEHPDVYLVLAFWRNNSSGTDDCIKRARLAYLPINIWRPGATKPEEIRTLF